MAGGVVYEFAKGTACFLYPTANASASLASQASWQFEDIEREIAELKARRQVREVRRAAHGREWHLHRGRCQGCVVQGHGRNIMAVIQRV
jgi:hypothetical protein